MGVSVEGLDELRELLYQVPEKMERNIPALLGSYGIKVVEFARNNHDFNTQSGRLENSISYTVEGNSLRIFLDPEFTTTNPSSNYPEGFDYGWAIHDGTKYMDEDPFLIVAIENSDELFSEALEEIVWRILNTL